MGRAKDVADEIAFVRSREADCHVLVDMLSKMRFRFALLTMIPNSTMSSSTKRVKRVFALLIWTP